MSDQAALKDATSPEFPVLLDGVLPCKVDPTKREKFLSVLRPWMIKQLAKNNFESEKEKEEFLKMRIDLLTEPETKLVTCALVVCTSLAQADKIVTSLNLWRFTKYIWFYAYLLEDFKKLKKQTNLIAGDSQGLQIVAGEEELLQFRDDEGNIHVTLKALLEEVMRPRGWMKSRHDPDRVQFYMALHHNAASTWQQLLQHYPNNVHLCLVFWRKLLIRVSSDHQPRCSDLPSLRPIPPTQLPRPTSVSRCIRAGQLGVLGALSKFTTQVVPDEFLTRRRPWTLANWIEIGGQEEHCAQIGGDFLRGLLLADQVDVLQVLMEQLQLSPGGGGTAEWEFPEKVPLLQYALQSASSNSTPFLLRLPGADVNTTHHFLGSSLLEIAVGKDDRRGVDFLLKQRGLQINNINLSSGGTALHRAVLHSEQLITPLFENGIDVRIQDKQGQTALHVAAAAKHKATVVSKLLSHPQIEVNCPDDKGRTPLHCAVMGHGASTRDDQLDTIEVLVKAQGVQLDATDKDGATPFGLVKNHFCPFIRYKIGLLLKEPLFEESVLFDAIENGGNEVLIHLEQLEPRWQLMETFRGAAALHRVLVTAIKTSNEKVVRWVLKQPGVDVNRDVVDQTNETTAAQETMSTPLLIAMRVGNMEIVQLLLDHRP